MLVYGGLMFVKTRVQGVHFLPDFLAAFLAGFLAFLAFLAPFLGAAFLATFLGAAFFALAKQIKQVSES